MTTESGPRPFWNPYVAGVGLGLTLLLSFIVLGTGLGASGGAARAAAALVHMVSPATVEGNAYLGPWFAEGSPLRHYLVFMGLGVLVGGGVSALFARRAGLAVERGPRASIMARLMAAAIGGAIVGFSSRLAGGCTSGQALTGGALLLSGSWAFMFAVFAGGYAVAPFVRRIWR